MKLTHSSHLQLVPIKIRKDKKHYIIENIDSGDFFEMPEVCIDAIKLINANQSLGEIEQQLKEKYPGEEVDILNFTEQLLDLNLIAAIDGEKIDLQKRKREPLGFHWISPKLGKFFFNKFSFLVYWALFLIIATLLISHPSLFPHYKDLFIFHLMLLNIPAWMVISVFLVLFHEVGHVLAMRAHNLPTRLDVSHRLFLVVLETDMSSVWKLPSKDRNVLYLAGLCFDTLTLSFALLSQLIFANGPGIFLSILQVIVLDTFIRMVYQCCIYMKTDLYFVFENITGCYNLMENAQHLIQRWFPFKKWQETSEVIFASERKTVSTYAIFYFVGIGLTIYLYGFFYLPQMFYSVSKVLPGLENSPKSLTFWDSTLFIFQLALGFALLLYSWRKKYLQVRA